MRVIVIGAGIVGVASAHCLAAAGCEVTVLERRTGVAQECSFANAGVIAPGYVTPWAAPGMPRKILGLLGRENSPVIFRPQLNPALWRWLLRWYGECELARYRVNRERMQRVALYSRAVLHEWRDELKLDYEQAPGYLQVFRSEQDLALVEPALTMLREAGVTHQRLNPAECRVREPGLGEIEFAGGVYLPDDEVGNCALFARLLRARSEATGARYVFNCQVQAIEPSSRGVMVHAQEDYAADAVLVAAGLDSTRLLAPLGLSIPLIAVRGYSATMPIAEPSCAPRSAIMDEAFKVAVTRLGNRVRVAGTAHLGGTSTRIEEAAYRTLIRVLRDWFPGCAELSRATYWTGARPMLPDGAPLLGASSVPGVFLNLGHGSTGWAMACGSARVSCDVILGRNPEIDLEGLGVARYQRRARA